MDASASAVSVVVLPLRKPVCNSVYSAGDGIWDERYRAAGYIRPITIEKVYASTSVLDYHIC